MPNDFQDYVKIALAKQSALSEERRYMLVNSIGEKLVERVLDIGCGAGYDLLQFLEKKDAFGFGIDIAKEVGKVGKDFFRQTRYENKVSFVCAKGEEIPFADETFDVVLCVVALPYMNNRRTLSEISRVLRPNGILLLKIHAPQFYFQMLKDRVKEKSLKSLVYPLIALANGCVYWLTNKQLENNFLKGKEMFLTEKLLERELKDKRLKINGYLPNNNRKTPAFIIIKECE
jgi:ubiquinone/menaquinone biosynthesis C-methylase UbiE